jgi:hypothetical protein
MPCLHFLLKPTYSLIVVNNQLLREISFRINMISTPVSLRSILDNDFYKITMQQGVIRLFPGARVRYKFINRGMHSFVPGFATALRNAVDEMALLQLTKAEKHFLRETCPYLDPVYLDLEWSPVVKLSDEHNKYTGSKKMISLAKRILDITDIENEGD